MIIVYWADVTYLLEQENHDRAFGLLPTCMQERILLYKRKEDRAVRLAGRLLLKKLLIDHGVTGWELIRSEHGTKPYIPESSISFNIAHAGLHVFVACSSTSIVGIDAEITRPLSTIDFIDYFYVDEWKKIMESASPERMLLHLWTRKEAALKAAGVGVAYPLGSLNVLRDIVKIEQQNWFLTTLPHHENYYVHLASSVPEDVVLFNQQTLA